MNLLRQRNDVLQGELGWLVDRIRVPRLRTMAEFAEAEIVVPDGPHAGLRYRLDRQPKSRLWFAEIDSGRWRYHWATGPTQSGKTLDCVIIPTLYHLFERREKVVFGLPHMDMARDKWREDLLPAIQASRFREFLPRHGKGSRGGTGEAIEFTNGVTLRFMSGGGDDKSRAGYTARVLVVTEVDGMDEAGEGSREADKVKQLEGRLLAHADDLVVYGECTVSIETGKIWRMYQGGTASRIVLSCPHCKGLVCPEREHLVGHLEAETKMAASRASYFACPQCGEGWSESDRRKAHDGSILVHRGQEITPDGTITGEIPDTDSLGFRWSAVNNLFMTAGFLGAKEWEARHDADEDNAEKEMCQFFWCNPWVPPEMADKPLEAEGIMRRMLPKHPRGRLPEGATHITVGCDIGKYLGHWKAWAWLPDGSSHVHDYGRFDIPSDHLPVDRAIAQALRAVRDEVFAAGWVSDEAGLTRSPDAVWIDSRYEPKAVRSFVKESGGAYKAIVGYGESRQKATKYARPKKLNQEIKWIGEEYHITWDASERCHVVHINSDHWKSKVQHAYSLPYVSNIGTQAEPVREPGAATIFQTMANEHMALAKHLTAERPHTEFEPGKGNVTKWITIRRGNHWLDAAMIGRCAGHFVGARMARRQRAAQTPADARRTSRFTTPDGQPFLITERE